MSNVSEANVPVERSGSERDIALNLLKKRGIMRLVEFREAGVSAATMRRMERDGEVLRLPGNIYRVPVVDWKYNHRPVVAAKGASQETACPVPGVLKANVSEARSGSQRDLARSLLEKRGIMRLVELREAGVSAATMSRMERGKEVVRLSRGIYQLSDAQRDSRHGYAKAAKRVPKGVVCLVSALAFHEITIQPPRCIWMATGNKDWAPRDSTGLRIVRFTDDRLQDDVETHVIEGVTVRVFGVSRTVVDCFRYRNKIGLGIAIEGLRWTFRRRKASPAEIARQAMKYKVWTVIGPYIDALLSDG